MEYTNSASVQKPFCCFRLVRPQGERVLYRPAVSIRNRLSSKRQAPILDLLGQHIEGMATEYPRRILPNIAEMLPQLLLHCITLIGREIHHVIHHLYLEALLEINRFQQVSRCVPE